MHFWSTPQLIANIPYPLLKYNTIYNGQTGHVVLSMDTDGDLTTIEDHELFQTTFNNGTWSPLTRLTTDTVSDDNPQLAIAPNGILLTWFKGAEISSVVNFDFNTRTVLKKDDTGYSSNLADFKLATSPTGKLAALWAEPSVENSSDVYALFYDSTTNQWGNSKQLTFDPQTERRIAATFVGNDVIALYNRGQVGNSATTTSNGNVPVASNTDLYMLKYSVRSVDFTQVNFPELGKALAFNSQGTPENLDARFAGGITTDGQAYSRNQLFSLSDYITLSGAITPASEHVGQSADIVAAGFYLKEGFLKTDEASAENCDPALADSVAKGGYYMMKQGSDQYCSWVVNNGNDADKNWCVSEADKNAVLRKRPETSGEFFSLWDGNLNNLTAIDTVTLKDFQDIPILYKGRFDAPGHVCFYFGYRLPNGTLVFNGEQTINVRIKP